MKLKIKEGRAIKGKKPDGEVNTPLFRQIFDEAAKQVHKPYAGKVTKFDVSTGEDKPVIEVWVNISTEQPKGPSRMPTKLTPTLKFYVMVDMDTRKVEMLVNRVMGPSAKTEQVFRKANVSGTELRKLVVDALHKFGETYVSY